MTAALAGADVEIQPAEPSLDVADDADDGAASEPERRAHRAAEPEHVRAAENAYRLIKPPIDDPMMPVASRSRRVRNLSVDSRLQRVDQECEIVIAAARRRLRSSRNGLYLVGAVATHVGNGDDDGLDTLAGDSRSIVSSTSHSPANDVSGSNRFCPSCM